MKTTFLIDNAVRELLINTYIGQLLRSTGDHYKIDDYDFFYSEEGYDFLKRTSYETDITVYPSYNVSRTPEQLSRAIRTKSIMVASHAEQIFNESLYSEKYNLGDTKSYNRHISGHLVWGEKFALSLQKYAGVPKEKIYIVGNPKLDINKKMSADANSGGKNKVLIVSDFSFGDLSDDEWKMFQKRYNSNYKTPLNKFFKEAREICVEWVNEMASQYPDLEFLIRIHPGESKDAYAATEQFDNVKVVGDRDFIDDLLSVDLVFSFTSTSIFEILSLQVPVFNLDLMEVPEERKLDYYELFDKVNKAEFAKILQDYREGKKFEISEGRSSLMAKYMYDPFSDKCMLRTTIALQEIYRQQNSVYSSVDHFVHYKNVLLSFLKNLIVHLGVFAKTHLKINNWVYSFAKKRRETEEKLNVTATRERISEAEKKSQLLVNDSEKEILKSSQFTIVQEEAGKYIYLNES